jgi:hypothetical protein
MIRRSFTAVVARNEPWSGEVATEPYECAWAGEAILFVRALEARGSLRAAKARVQISPDGIHWVDEGTAFPMPAKKGDLTFGRVRHFGGFLRLVARVPPRASVKVLVTLALKE